MIVWWVDWLKGVAAANRRIVPMWLGNGNNRTRTVPLVESQERLWASVEIN